MGHLKSLERFDASYNLLTGDIKEFIDLPNLVEFRVSGNFLDGPLPNLSAAPALVFFEGDDNLFTGPVPDISALEHLSVFSVKQNKLSGPLTFGDTGYVRQFRVAGNHLTGPIPLTGSLLAQAKSSLCPNAFEFSPGMQSPNDSKWDLAVGAGAEHWWGPPGRGCDGIFDNGVE